MLMMRPMRSNEIFSQMTPDAALAFLDGSIAGAGGGDRALGGRSAFRLRPVFLRRQPRKRQSEWMRQALARNAFAAVAEEVLAEYFLEYHAELLGELLDAFGLEHEKGVLKEPNDIFRRAKRPDDLDGALPAHRGQRGVAPRLLLRAFAAQSAIDWPDLKP